MKEELRNYYERELAYLREIGREFAEDHPKIAERLALDPRRQPRPARRAAARGHGAADGAHPPQDRRRAARSHRLAARHPLSALPDPHPIDVGRAAPAGRRAIERLRDPARHHPDDATGRGRAAAVPDRLSDGAVADRRGRRVARATDHGDPARVATELSRPRDAAPPASRRHRREADRARAARAPLPSARRERAHPRPLRDAVRRPRPDRAARPAPGGTPTARSSSIRPPSARSGSRPAKVSSPTRGTRSAATPSWTSISAFRRSSCSSTCTAWRAWPSWGPRTRWRCGSTAAAGRGSIRRSDPTTFRLGCTPIVNLFEQPGEPDLGGPHQGRVSRRGGRPTIRSGTRCTAWTA